MVHFIVFSIILVRIRSTEKSTFSYHKRISHKNKDFRRHFRVADTKFSACTGYRQFLQTLCFVHRLDAKVPLFNEGTQVSSFLYTIVPSVNSRIYGHKAISTQKRCLRREWKGAEKLHLHLCRACLHSFFIDRQSARELRITRIPRDAVI